jgi:glycosyltransferase involved in cell wall biosynthesis
MAMGLAIIASRVGGFNEIVEDGVNGYLFSPDDAVGMQSGLRSLLSDRKRLYEVRQQSRHLASRFDLQRIIGSYADAYREVINNR